MLSENMKKNKKKTTSDSSAASFQVPGTHIDKFVNLDDNS